MSQRGREIRWEVLCVTRVGSVINNVNYGVRGAVMKRTNMTYTTLNTTSRRLTLETSADSIAVLLGREVIPIAVASGVDEKTAAAGLFVEIGSHYVRSATAFLHGLAADLYNQCETVV